MTTVWIDPAELTAMAATLQSLAAAVDGATTTVSTACACDVPAPIADYVAGELACVECCGAAVVTGLSADAAELATRAAVIAQDQSLATAASSAFGPGLADPSGWPAGDLGAGVIGGGGNGWSTGDWTTQLIGSTVVGGPGAFLASSSASSDGFFLGAVSGPAIVGGPGAFLASSSDLNSSNGYATPGLIGPTIVGGNYHNGIASLPGPIFDIVSNSNANIIGTILAPNGLTFRNGMYEDGGGDRSSSLSGAYIDPSGRYDL
jgi:hypothetical protein